MIETECVTSDISLPKANWDANSPLGLSLCLLGGFVFVLLLFQIVQFCLASFYIPFKPIQDQTIAINYEPYSRLRLLPGIGPTVGRLVIEQRDREPFHDSDDLIDRVKGIGPGFAEANKRWLKFDVNSRSIHNKSDARSETNRVKDP